MDTAGTHQTAIECDGLLYLYGGYGARLANAPAVQDASSG
jgi:hypothetical protein